MAYRDDVEALAARHAALENELAAKTREVDAAATLLAEARQRTKLPILPNLRVASPCGADWAAMTGDERVRHCGSCDKKVYDLSGLTRDEAESLIIEKEGKLCVRYFQRADGTILLKDCTVGAARRRRRRVIAAGAVALLAGGAALVLGRGDEDGGTHTLGAAAVPGEALEPAKLDVTVAAPDVPEQPLRVRAAAGGRHLQWTEHKGDYAGPPITRDPP